MSLIEQAMLADFYNAFKIEGVMFILTMVLQFISVNKQKILTKHNVKLIFKKPLNTY